MPNAEKQNFEWQTVTCPQCDGFGARNRPLVGEVECDRCGGKGEVQQKRKVAVASSHWRNGKSLDSLGADGQEVATVNNSLTVQAQDRLESLRQWADDNCPEGVAGAPENVRWLLSYAEGIARVNLHKRLSDAITLLYTHGLITDKMRAHARGNL